jgi:hypothetical protein
VISLIRLNRGGYYKLKRLVCQVARWAFTETTPATEQVGFGRRECGDFVVGAVEGAAARREVFTGSRSPLPEYSAPGGLQQDPGRA